MDEAGEQFRALAPMTLEEYYQLERAMGSIIRVIQGRGWRQVRPGFWRPAFPFQTVPRGSAQVPVTSWMVGYQHAVDDWKQANSALRFIVYENPREYRLDREPKGFRQNVRRALKTFVVREIGGAKQFVEEAWPVYCSFWKRTRYAWRSDRIRRDRFAAWSAALFSSGKVMVFGAYRDGHLMGVNSVYQVGQVVVAGPTFCHTAALKDRVSDALLHVLRTVAAQCVDAVCLFRGMASGKPSLDAAKLERGALPVEVPAYCRLQPWAYLALRIFWPDALRRLGLFVRPGNMSGDQQQKKVGETGPSKLQWKEMKV